MLQFFSELPPQSVALSVGMPLLGAAGVTCCMGPAGAIAFAYCLIWTLGAHLPVDVSGSLQKQISLMQKLGLGVAICSILSLLCGVPALYHYTSVVSGANVVRVWNALYWGSVLTCSLGAFLYAHLIQMLNQPGLNTSASL